MRITKTDLKQMVLEILREQEEDPTKIKSGAMSVSQRKKGSLQRIQGAEDEFTPSERKIVDQIEAYISNLAAVPDIDLMQHRPKLERVLNLLQGAIADPQQKNNQTDVPQGETA